MANDAQEEFWGVTLSKDKKEYVWDPSSESEEDVEHKLQLTTACIGHKAKEGDRNVVEVTTEDGDGKKVTCPFVSLRVGGTECIHLDLGFYNTTKFTLSHGAGPISLCGVHLKALPLDFDENDEDSSDDEEVPDLVPEDSKKPVKKLNESDKLSKMKQDQKNAQMKRPLPADKEDKQPPKKKKPVIKESSEEDEVEDEEDEEMEEQSSLLDNEAEEGSEEDTDIESDDMDADGDDEEGGEEDDDSEADDDEDDDEEEDESEEEEKTKTKKKVNGQTPKQTPGKGAPPKNKTQPKTPVDHKKTPGKKDNTPKSQQAKKTPVELKAFLLKSPNLPKKFDKFANFMKNNMKVTDEKSQKDLWDYVQKNKK